MERTKSKARATEKRWFVKIEANNASIKVYGATRRAVMRNARRFIEDHLLGENVDVPDFPPSTRKGQLHTRLLRDERIVN